MMRPKWRVLLFGPMVASMVFMNLRVSCQPVLRVWVLWGSKITYPDPYPSVPYPKPAGVWKPVIIPTQDASVSWAQVCLFLYYTNVFLQLDYMYLPTTTITIWRMNERTATTTSTTNDTKKRPKRCVINMSLGPRYFFFLFLFLFFLLLIFY